MLGDNDTTTTDSAPESAAADPGSPDAPVTKKRTTRKVPAKKTGPRAAKKTAAPAADEQLALPAEPSADTGAEAAETGESPAPAKKAAKKTAAKKTAAKKTAAKKTTAKAAAKKS